MRWWMSHSDRVCTLCCELLSSDSFFSSADSEKEDMAGPGPAVGAREGRKRRVSAATATATAAAAARAASARWPPTDLSPRRGVGSRGWVRVAGPRRRGGGAAWGGKPPSCGTAGPSELGSGRFGGTKRLRRSGEKSSSAATGRRSERSRLRSGSRGTLSRAPAGPIWRCAARSCVRHFRLGVAGAARARAPAQWLSRGPFSRSRRPFLALRGALPSASLPAGCRRREIKGKTLEDEVREEWREEEEEEGA